MNITLTARHFKATEKLQDYVQKEIRTLEKYFDRITDCEVILSYQKLVKEVELVLNVPQETLKVKAESDDFQKSVDQAVLKMERQLTKYKDKLRKK